MSKDALDSIPEKCRLGLLTRDQGAMKVLEVIYTNPALFDLDKMSVDDRSDFLLDNLERFKKMIDNYNPSIGAFGAYVYYSIPGMKITWQKKRFEKENTIKALRHTVCDIYEIKREKLELAVSEKSPFEKGGGLYAQEGKKENGPETESLQGENNRLVFRRIFKRDHGSVLAANKIHQKRSALILALKSAWYLDDGQIDDVCNFCGLSKKDFYEKISDIRKTLMQKNSRHSDLLERRDRAWYFVCRYRERLNRLDKDSELYGITKKKLEYQLRSWKNKTAALKNCVSRVTPENAYIAKLLNMNPNRVSAYVNYAKKMTERGETIQD